MPGYGMGYYRFFDPTMILVLIGVVLSMAASAKVQSTFAKYSRVRSMTGMTGAEAAKRIMNSQGNVAIEDGHITLTENENAMLDNPKQKHAFHGLYRSLVHNMVVGVSEGYKKELELVGVGYRASNQGNIIELALGYTHNIFIQLADAEGNLLFLDGNGKHNGFDPMGWSALA